MASEENNSGITGKDVLIFAGIIIGGVLAIWGFKKIGELI